MLNINAVNPAELAPIVGN